MQEYNWFTGNKIRVGIYGESHSPSIGVCLEGLDYDKLDTTALAAFMKRRAPGQNAWSTPRKEEDAVVVDLLQKGLFKAHIDNTNIKPHDYSNLLITPRPGHADFTARLKYGDDFKSSGGGAFSGRLTAPLCIAGFLAKSYLEDKGIKISAHIKSIAGVKDETYNFDNRTNEEDFLKKLEEVSKKEFPVIDDTAGEQMKEKIAQAREQGNSVGGTIEVVVQGMPGGIGGPIFEGIEARIAELCFAVPACKGVEFGNGFEAAEKTGSTNNDCFVYERTAVPEPVEGPSLKTNRCGGILGGISVGGTVAPIVFDVAVKPTPTISKEQATVNLETKENTTITVGGRHDPCIVPRAMPVYEAVAALALADVISSDAALREPQGPRLNQEGPLEDLTSLRTQIDQADEQLLTALAKRMEVAEKIGLLKKQEGKAVLDTSREAQKLESIYEKTDERTKPYIKDIYKKLFEASRDLQSKL
ncbi:MAG: chorismate synthase [Treponema sp.]|nr:chorismate synthase [Treponema sp.]